MANIKAQMGTVLVMSAMMLTIISGLFLPLETAGALYMCVFFLALGIVGLSLMERGRDRDNLIKLFIAAYILRVLFTLLAYAFGIVELLGGADDTGWKQSWWISRYWLGYETAPPNVADIPGVRPPLTFWEVVNGEYGHNRGWHWIMANFFYLLEIKSQITVSFFNCFFNSLTACVIYRAARDFYSEKAALLAAGACVIFPGFLAWSALTIKEPWVICLEIAAFFFTIRAVRDRNPWMAALALFTLSLTYSMRFYVGYIVVLAMVFAAVAFNAQRPRVAATRFAVAATFLVVAAFALELIKFDVAGFVQQNMDVFTQFRDNISGKTQQGGSVDYGTNTGVQFDYDPNTPGGLLMIMATGATYLLFSPFPWALSGKQLLTLPDVAIWWFLVFVYIIPGIRSAWREQPALAVTLTTYLVPLILLYSLVFGNIGLAYRQRAQLMPFFLIFAAAGYDARERRKRKTSDKPDAAEIIAQLRALQQAPPVPQTPVSAAVRHDL